MTLDGPLAAWRTLAILLSSSFSFSFSVGKDRASTSTNYIVMPWHYSRRLLPWPRDSQLSAVLSRLCEARNFLWPVRRGLSLVKFWLVCKNVPAPFVTGMTYHIWTCGCFFVCTVRWSMKSYPGISWDLGDHWILNLTTSTTIINRRIHRTGTQLSQGKFKAWKVTKIADPDTPVACLESIWVPFNIFQWQFRQILVTIRRLCHRSLVMCGINWKGCSMSPLQWDSLGKHATHVWYVGLKIFKTALRISDDRFPHRRTRRF